MRRSVTCVVSALAVGLALTGCADDEAERQGADPAGGEQLEVLAAFYPYHFLAERVGGDAVSVELLTEPGIEPHDLELGPQQVSDIESADVVIYQEGFQPAVDEAVEQNPPEREVQVNGVLGRAPDAEPEDAHSDDEHSEGEPTEDGATEDGHSEEEHSEDEASGTETSPDATTAPTPTDEEQEARQEDVSAAADAPTTDLSADPHVWLDTDKLAEITEAVADTFAEADPDNAEDYRDRADDLVADLEELDEDYRTALENCERDTVVVNHAAFGHLTSRYGLEQLPVSGITPDAEPSPSRLAELAELIREQGITTVYTETLVSPRVAETLAAETGADTATLDPLEGLAADDERDYLDVMRDNLEALEEGLGCDAESSGSGTASPEPSVTESPTSEGASPEPSSDEDSGEDASPAPTSDDESSPEPTSGE